MRCDCLQSNRGIGRLRDSRPPDKWLPDKCKWLPDKWLPDGQARTVAAGR